MTLALVVLDLLLIAVTARGLMDLRRATSTDTPLPHWPESLELDVPVVAPVDPLEMTAVLARERARVRSRAPRFVAFGPQRLAA
jgi:hypothetical protein